MALRRQSVCSVEETAEVARQVLAKICWCPCVSTDAAPQAPFPSPNNIGARTWTASLCSSACRRSLKAWPGKSWSISTSFLLCSVP
eukprot:8144346-Karenia_brevis.AAC.1